MLFTTRGLLLSAVWLITLGLVSPALAGPIFTNSFDMEFIWIPPGEFTMGEAISGEPARQVTIRQPFFIGKYEVTRAQWEMVMGLLPPDLKNSDHPVANIAWTEAQMFIAQLNEAEQTDAYRLPTEAEWEYAARAGTETAFAFGDSPAEIVFYAWYNFNSGGASHPVGLKKANAFVLHDMFGNVSEWVQDLYAQPKAAPEELGKGAHKADSGGRRVVRGCAFRHDAEYCRAGRRFNFDAEERNDFIGFRVLREAR